jgi:hypothetical protein
MLVSGNGMWHGDTGLPGEELTSQMIPTLKRRDCAPGLMPGTEEARITSLNVP